MNINNPTRCTPNFAAQTLTESKDSSNTNAPINIKIKTPTQRQMMWSWLGNTDSLQRTGPACYLLNPWHFESVFGINALEGIQHLRAGGLESSAGLWLAGLVSESLPVRGTCLQPKWDPLFQSEARRHCLNYPPSPAITHHHHPNADPSSPPSQQEEGGKHN